MPTNKLNGAQVIVDYLIQEKVPNVFGLCGHGNIQFIDALYERQSDIKTISVHHESVAGFMADVYYRVSGKPTATFTSCGPGSANLPISLAKAYLDSVPFMAVTGNVPTSQFNRGAFQEMYRHYQADFPSTVRSYCKKVFQPTRGEMVPLAVRQAWKTMVTGRPGPVVLTCRSTCSWKRPPRRRRGRRNGAPIFPAAAAPIRKAWSRPSTCCSARSGRACWSDRACVTAAPARNCCGSRSGCKFRSRRRRAGSARSILIIRSRSGWWRAAATTRPIMPRARPTSCWRSASASTIGRRAHGSPAIPSPSRRPSSSMSISIRRRSAATIRSRSG